MPTPLLTPTTSTAVWAEIAGPDISPIMESNSEPSTTYQAQSCIHLYKEVKDATGRRWRCTEPAEIVAQGGTVTPSGGEGELGGGSGPVPTQQNCQIVTIDRCESDLSNNLIRVGKIQCACGSELNNLTIGSAYSPLNGCATKYYYSSSPSFPVELNKHCNKNPMVYYQSAHKYPIDNSQPKNSAWASYNPTTTKLHFDGLATVDQMTGFISSSSAQFSQFILHFQKPRHQAQIAFLQLSLPMDGVCGLPTGNGTAELCEVGTTSGWVSTGGQESWSCLGSGGGATANCQGMTGSVPGDPTQGNVYYYGGYPPSTPQTSECGNPHYECRGTTLLYKSLTCTGGATPDASDPTEWRPFIVVGQYRYWPPIPPIGAVQPPNINCMPTN